MQKVLIAADHAGFDLKEALKRQMKEVAWDDLGTDSKESCDYPLFTKRLCERLLEEGSDETRGILICGTGQGMAMAANKYPRIRAAVVAEEFSAEMAREHNNAQVLCLGARVVDEETAIKCVRAFLTAKFDRAHPRHKRRVHQIDEIFLTNCKQKGVGE